MTGIPRPEYPRPQFERGEATWINLNGEWEFAEDPQCSGKERGLPGAASLPMKIRVPFCRESVLSGIGNTDFCECVWYRRAVSLPDGWVAADRRVMLNIGACDWKTEAWINGKYAGLHVGGYVSFSFDITSFLHSGENVITLRATDRLRSGAQAGGKQSVRYASYGCSYTRTTGIWQTVWLELLPAAHICSAKYYPDPASSSLKIEATAAGAEGMTLAVSASYDGRQVGQTAATVGGGVALLSLQLDELHLWEVGQGRLYDLTLTLGEDVITSYFGMRTVRVHDGILHINGKPVFQRLVLDQGFYPDGIYTARDDGELIADVKRSLACGFNGARLHQKIFEPRFLYHCDRLGYIVWGEHGNWGLDLEKPTAWEGFIPEWLECLARDFNHPAIVGWCPLNETQRNQSQVFVRSLAGLTRAYDPTRAYIDASGWSHIEGLSDIVDNHDYEQNPAVFRERYEALAAVGEPVDTRRNAFPIVSTFVSEYGGIRWAPDGAGWGYGNAPGSGEEFVERFRGLTDVLLDCPVMGGLCYTQLTDVEQEVNGLYTYDRKPKFPPEVFFEILRRPAAIELAAEDK